MRRILVLHLLLSSLLAGCGQAAVPMEPEDSMAEVESPNNAQEGEVVFIVPATTTSVELWTGEENPTTFTIDL